jgi:DNA-binding transcriptional ArsR family regulator
VTTDFDADFEAMRENAHDAAAFLKGIANEHRLMVLCALSQGELSVGELNKEIGLSQSALSQHLSVLRGQGLVSTRRESQTIYYSLASQPAQDIIDVLHQSFCAKA